MRVHLAYLSVISLFLGIAAYAQVATPPVGVQPVEIKDELLVRLKAVEDRLATLEKVVRVTPSSVTIEAVGGITIKSQSQISVQTPHSISLRSGVAMDIKSGATLNMEAGAGMKLRTGLPIIVNDGQRPVARVGDIVVVKSRRYGQFTGSITRADGSMLALP